MSEYWKAKADPNLGYSQYSGQTHYGPHQLSSEPFTPEATDGTSGMKIEEIEMRIHNMHPEQISALADQWLNAWTLLSQVHEYVLEQSNVLNDEGLDLLFRSARSCKGVPARPWPTWTSGWTRR